MSENRDAIELADETVLTEIILQPDGRVYVFGASREVLEVLDLISPHDSRLRAILGCTREVGGEIAERAFVGEGEAPAEPRRAGKIRLPRNSSRNGCHPDPPLAASRTKGRPSEGIPTRHIPSFAKPQAAIPMRTDDSAMGTMQ
jgi:hypothetical protein